MMNRILLMVFSLFLCLTTVCLSRDFDFYPGTMYSPNVPTLNDLVGHAWGESITSHAEMERYIHELAEATPNVKIVEYGQTWEGRTLYYLIVASQENMNRLDDIKDGMQKLADPRKTSQGEAESLVRSLPSVVWLAYGVHGNEISSTDAGLLTAYHLVAAENDSLADAILKNTVVIIDPLQNPDGRDRFVHYYRQTGARWPDPDPQAAEHNEDWPGGRTNHYLFDMNRDWFVQTQPESRGRVKAFLEWYPQVFVDLHEMGSNSTYYFAPPADPINPEFTAAQVKWLERFGRNNARWFDRLQFDYFTREIFDAFYPGYGEGWPMLHGAIGMTYEQASTRGLVVKRDDESILHYREAVRHHFISSLATAETAARNREELLRYFYDYRASASREGAQGAVKEYIIPPGQDPDRAAKLAGILVAQGVEVKQAEAPFSNSKVRDYYEERLQSKNFPAGTFVISAAQPAKRVLTNMLTKHLPMDEAFVQEQLRRHKKRLPDEIYDVTAWSLPLLFDVEAYRAETESGGRFTTLAEVTQPAGLIHGGKAQLAYLMPWGTQSAAKALARLFREEINVYCAGESFKLNGISYPSGSLIIKVKDNPEDLHERLQTIANETGADIYATNTSWVDEGINFGSNQVQYLEKPKVAMAYEMPTHPYSVGWTRYLLERAYGYPVTIINTRQLPRFDLSKYNVLILSNTAGFYGSYDKTIGEEGAKKLKTWVEQGGTLVSFGEATRWLTDEKVGLLETTRELRGGKREKAEKKPEEEKSEAEKAQKPEPKPTEPFDYETAILPEKEPPASTPGAIMRITVDTEFWPGFGYDDDTNVLVSSRNIFRPLKLDKGRNIGVYMSEDKVLLSGFTWEDSKKQIAKKAYLMYQPHGRGHVVAFAEDPNFRAFCDGLNVLFLNAVFLGPAH